MKIPVSIGKLLLLCLILCVTSFSAFSQQTLTKINGWNAWVHLPDDYNTTGTQKYPLIVFFPGTGEVGSDANRLLSYGPSKFIASGWNGNVTLSGKTIKPIIISLQPAALYPKPNFVDDALNIIKSTYRVDITKVNLTGLSHGGWMAEMYAMAYPDKVASVVALQAVRPDDNPAYPAPFATYAQKCGHWLGYEQIYDQRDMSTIANKMNATVPGSAVYIKTNVGGGGHCCWNTWYDPNHSDSYSLNGTSGNWTIYQYMMTWTGCATPPPTTPPPTTPPPTTPVPPVVNAGSDKTITLPTNTISLTGTATSAAGLRSSKWTKTSGPSARIVYPDNNMTTPVEGLVAGSYVFTLTATDNNGLVTSDNMNVVVNTSGSGSTNPPPVTSGKVIQVNLYGGSNPYSSTAWNNWNVSSTASTSAAFNYSDGTTSPVTANLNYSQGVADNGTAYGGTMAPSQVLRYATYCSGTRTLTINNIPVATSYTLELYGSRANSGNSTSFIVNGATVKVVTDNNLANPVVFSNVSVLNGKIEVVLDKTGSFNYLNGFKLSIGM